MARYQFESDRISVKEENQSLEITISGTIPPTQMTILTAWIILWTFAGGFVISQIFTPMDEATRGFMGIWLAFWAYFEYKIGKAWLWRKYGKEVFRMNPETAELNFEVGNGGSKKSLITKDLRNLKNFESEKGFFTKTYFSSFWVVGGETIGFYSKGKLLLFGRQLSTNDSDKLIKIMQPYYRKWTN